MRNARARRAKTNLGHRLFELLTVFRFINSLWSCADQLDAVLVQHTMTPEIERAIERGLTTHRRQNRIRLFFVDDALDYLPGNWLDVGDVRHLGVGHDGRGVAIDQNDFVTFFAQCLTGLCAGIIELARLTNDDRAGTDDQDALYIVTLRHADVSPSWRQSDRIATRCHAARVRPRGGPENRMRVDPCARSPVKNHQTARHA